MPGIPYNRYYFFCLHCSLAVCTSCNSKHPSNHRPYLMRIRDKMLPRDAIASGTTCSKCEASAETYVACNAESTCSFKLCGSCLCKEKDEIKGHQHKAFTWVRLPDDYQLASYDSECSSCLMGSSLGHCSRCLEGMALQQIRGTRSLIFLRNHGR